MAKRYQPSELIGEQGGVQTFAGRDVVNGLPVRVYSFVGEPTLREGELRSDFVPPVLSSSFTGLAGEVVSAFSDEFKKAKGAVAPGQVEALLRETAAALDDAAKAGVVHGDLSPERVFFDREGGTGGRFVLEGYGVPWPVRPSEFSAPERIGGASFAADMFSWARTVKHLSGPLSGELRDLLDRCLSADPAARPHTREVCAALEGYPFSGNATRPNPQARRDTSAFERYADFTDDETDDETERDGLAEGRGLTLPPKIFKLKEYERQQAAKQPPAEAEPKPVQPNPPPEQLTATSSPTFPDRTLDRAHPSNPPRRTGQVKPSGTPQTTKPQHSADLLMQLDATEAYRARLAAYNVKHRGQTSDQTSDQTSAQASAQNDTTQTAPLAATSAPETVAQQETAQADEPAPHVRVRPIPDAGEAAHAGKSRNFSDVDNSFDPDDFEVIDDIDDRAPDPTLYRGGRRVLLLTLLGIALLVLLALQFI